MHLAARLFFSFFFYLLHLGSNISRWNETSLTEEGVPPRRDGKIRCSWNGATLEENKSDNSGKRMSEHTWLTPELKSQRRFSGTFFGVFLLTRPYIRWAGAAAVLILMALSLEHVRWKFEHPWRRPGGNLRPRSILRLDRLSLGDGAAAGATGARWWQDLGFDLQDVGLYLIVRTGGTKSLTLLCRRRQTHFILFIWFTFARLLRRIPCPNHPTLIPVPAMKQSGLSSEEQRRKKWPRYDHFL